MTNPTMAIFASMIAEAETNMQRLEKLIAANPSVLRISLEIWQQLMEIKPKRIEGLRRAIAKVSTFPTTQVRGSPSS